MRRPRSSSPTKTATQATDGITPEQAALSTSSPAHRAVEAAQIGTWEWRLASGRVEWSPQADTIFGLAPGDFSGTFESFLSLVHPSDRAQLQAAIQTAIETRQPYHLDHRIITPGGIIRWVSCRGHAVQDSDGQVAGMAGMTEDITSRKEAELTLADLQELLEQRVRERTAGLEQAVRDLQEEVGRRCQTEAALKASEQRYHALYEHNPTMYFTLTPDGTVLSVNRFGAEELGYREEELAGQSVLAVFQMADHHTVLEQLRICSQSPGRTFDWVIQKVQKGGQLLWVKERARAITGPDGSPIILIVCEDITEQRQAEAAHTRSEERLRSFLNALDDLAFELDEYGVYLNVWTRNDDLLLLPKREIVGKTLDEIHGPQAGNYYRTVIHRVLDSGTPESVEYSLHLNGHLRHFAAILSRIPAGVDHSPTVAAIIRETTKQKLAEESARELNLALSNAMPGIARLNKDGCYVTINPYYASALGYDPDELIGRSWTPTVHADDFALVAQAFDQLHTHGKSEFEARGLRKNGTTFFKQVLMVRIDGTNGERIGHHCFMRDITDRKQAQTERERISQDLHDNLLQSLYAVGMQLEAGKLLMGKAQRKSKQHVTQAIQQLNHLVLEVRQFITGLTSHTAPAADFHVAMNQLVASCSSETRTAPALDLDPTALTAVTPAIGEQLLSIAREALSNSIRHADATHRSVSLTKTDDSIRLRVVDNGKGFAPGRKRRRGLGLANMAARSRTIGAQFTLDSAPDRGTSITIDIPTGDPHAC